MSKIGIIQLCSKFDKGMIYISTNFARFCTCILVIGKEGYRRILSMQRVLMLKFVIIRENVLLKILKSIKLFNLFETDL